MVAGPAGNSVSMQLSTPSSISSSVAFVADALALDSSAIDAISDLTLPDVNDVLSDASDLVADSAIVIGRHGGRLVGRTMRIAWRNRSTVAVVIITALAIVGLASIVKRRSGDDVDDVTSS